MNVYIKLMTLCSILVLSSCNNKVVTAVPKDATCKCNEFLAQGQIEYKKVTFCGISAPTEEYSHKVGLWRYWNSKGKLIAEGEYMSKKRIVEGEGGCTYEIIQGKIDRSQWKFYNADGFPIDVSDLTIKKYETCDVRLIQSGN